MKAIINWIILIPVLILAVGVELFSALNPEGAQKFFGMDTNGLTVTAISTAGAGTVFISHIKTSSKILFFQFLINLNYLLLSFLPLI